MLFANNSPLCWLLWTSPIWGPALLSGLIATLVLRFARRSSWRTSAGIGAGVGGLAACAAVAVIYWGIWQLADHR